MARRSKAARQSDIDDAHICLHEKITRFLQAQFHIVALWRAIEIAPEEPFELARGHAHVFGKHGWADRLFVKFLVVAALLFQAAVLSLGKEKKLNGV